MSRRPRKTQTVTGFTACNDMMRPPTLKKRQAGFTLVEMAMVLLIIGLLLGGLFPTLSTQMDIQRVNETKRQLEDIKEALVGFAVAKGRLPCPADGTAADGNELVTGTTCTLTKGVLPWSTLGVPETDGWGRRFTYRVAANFADYTDTNDFCNSCEHDTLRVDGISGVHALFFMPGTPTGTLIRSPNILSHYLEDSENNDDDNDHYVTPASKDTDRDRLYRLQ